jgi:hypothetical protein
MTARANIIQDRPEKIRAESHNFKEVIFGKLGQPIETTLSQDKPVVKGAGDNEEHEENHHAEKKSIQVIKMCLGEHDVRYHNEDDYPRHEAPFTCRASELHK